MGGEMKTPRTDEFQKMEHVASDWMWREHAKQLERELAEVTKQRDELLQAIEGYDTTEVNYSKWQCRVKNAVDNCRRGK
jgi:hypothetical protein